MVNAATTAELIFAAGVLIACAGLLLHMLLPAAQRRRLDEVVRAFMQLMRAIGLRLLGKSPGRSGSNTAAANKRRRSGASRAVRLVDPPSTHLSKREPKPPGPQRAATTDDAAAPLEVDPQAEQDAQKEAQDIIDRARRQAREGKPVDRDGNVYRPDAFKSRPPPPDQLH